MPGENVYVDTEKGLQRIRGNTKTYLLIMQMFLDSKDLGALEDSLDEKDYARAAELSHGVKGMSGNVSLPLLFDVSTRLNDQLKLGPPDEQTVAEYRVVLDETKKQVLAEMERIKAGQ